MSLRGDGPQISGLGDLSDALRIRERAMRRRRWRWGAVIGLAVVLGVALVWLIGFSSVLTIRTVRVSGNQLASTQQVLDAAHVPIGSPLARLNTKAVEAGVKNLPMIETVKVKRGWPRTAIITITEHQPVYQREDATGYQWVWGNGLIFHTSDKPQPGVLVATTGGVDARLLADVATVAEAIPAQVRPRVQHIDASSRDHIVLILDKDQKVLWGSADDSNQKATVLPAVLTVPGRSFDISAPSHPAVS